MTKDEMVGWHYQHDKCEFEQTPEDSERQGSLACCSPWSLRESNKAERLNNNKGAEAPDLKADFSDSDTTEAT